MIMSRDLTTVEVAEKEDSMMTKRTPPFHTQGLRSILLITNASCRARGPLSPRLRDEVHGR